MNEQLTLIIKFVVNAFIHIWPYLIITIPVAVAVNISGAARHINKVFRAKPFVSIILATAVGAFSPFCSCGVIPVIASLLLGGVPLAPVMSFWLASPSMDPEMFFLSGATLGWELAVWRLASTFLLSLSAGFITHYLWEKGWLGETYVKIGAPANSSGIIKRFKRRVTGFGKTAFNYFVTPPEAAVALSNAAPECGCGDNAIISENIQCGCGDAPGKAECQAPCPEGIGTAYSDKNGNESFKRKLFNETVKATLMVLKFMALAFILEAIIVLYIPDKLIISTLGRGSVISIFWGAFIGIPVYTSNLSALPLIGGLLQQGMSPAAALAFLISGPITTIPALAAVKGLTTKKVFYLYVSFSFFGALFFGYLYYLTGIIF